MTEIDYNPSLSVAENAKQNKVSVATIRKHIKELGIDRRYDEKLKIYNKVKELQRLHPEFSASEIAKQTQYSLNTVKKYLQLSDLPLPSASKFSSFDYTKCRNVIKSVSTSQTTILRNILQLYIKSDQYDADFTYSVGGFYSKIKQPKLKYDKFPHVDGVKPLDEATLIPSGTLQSIVVDLPFLIKGNASIMTDRFNAFSTEDELYEANTSIIKLAYQKLKRRGYLVMKTMDSSNTCFRQLWVSDFVVQKALETGFELKDKFILVAQKRPLHTGKTQYIARKYHSYFLVFKKN